VLPDAPIVDEPDPLGLPDFFPAMRPIQIMRRASSLTPICPYQVYKPLIDELDVITKRISKLVRTLKVRGITDAELSIDFEQLRSCDDGMYLPAQNATKFAGHGSGLGQGRLVLADGPDRQGAPAALCAARPDQGHDLRGHGHFRHRARGFECR
jgi:hypothetical protein